MSGEPSLTEMPSQPGLHLAAAAELQDHLMVANNDLARLQGLLDGASQALMLHFSQARAQLDGAMAAPICGCQDLAEPLAAARQTLGVAITALQFQDMAKQLIAHTSSRLRHCADRLAQDAFAGDEDGAAVVEPLPSRPNPVTQDEMDAGAVELF